MSLNDDLAWRYACQQFQPGKRCDAPLAAALECARLAPSSFGVQPWRVVQVEDTALRAALPGLCYGQESVRDAGHLLVFAYSNPLTTEQLLEHAELVAQQRGFSPAEQDAFAADLIKTLLTKRDPDQQAAWARDQCYLGLGVFLAACAAHRVDTCPMEGFLPEKVDALLGLSDMGLASAVLVAVGHRAVSDTTARAPKTRMPQANFLHQLGDAPQTSSVTNLAQRVRSA